MSEAFSHIAATSLEDHEIHLYYRLPPVSLETGPMQRLGEIADKHGDASSDRLAILPNDQVAALAGRYRDEPVWEEVREESAVFRDSGKFAISSDLNPAIGALFRGERPELVRRWRLSVHARRLINSADLYESDVPPNNRIAKLLHLEFGKAAKERLSASSIGSSKLRVQIKQLEVIAFVTGVSFLVARVTFERPDRAPLFASELNEAVCALSRFNRCKWASAEDRMNVDGPEFSVGALVRSLVQGHVNSSVLSQRVHSFVFARLSKTAPPLHAEALAAYLSRRYSSDYRFNLERSSLRLIREFHNIRHAVSEEGLATVIMPDEQGCLPQFLEAWKTSVFQSAYSPLVLLLLHEQRFLTRNRAEAIATRQDESAIEKFEAIIDDALMFRLCFRFGHVSDISMHNAFSNAFRDVLHLDRKLDEMESDVRATSARLLAAVQQAEAHEAQVKHHRYYWITVLSGSALAALTTYTIFKEVFSLVLYPDKSAAGWGAVAAGGVILVLAMIFGVLRRPKKPEKHHENHLTTHAMLEHMIKRALG